MKKTLVIACTVVGVTSLAACGASKHTTAPELRALQHARAEIPFLRDFPSTPGTTHCLVHPGGLQRPGTVFHGSCTTSPLRRSANGRVRVVFSERFHLYSPSGPTHRGSFTATLSPVGHVLHIDATGQTPQTWK